MNGTRSNREVSDLPAVAQVLLERSGDDLCGARQVTVVQMVEHLGRTFQLSQTEAENLFDCLKEAGVVTWDREADDGSFTDDESHRHRWRISIEPLSQADQKPLRIKSHDAETSAADETRPAVDLLHRAIRARATDIHLDPYGDELEVRFRIDGRLEHYCRMSHDVGMRLITQLKVMANVDIADPFHSQESRLNLPISLSDHAVRFTAMRVTDGEAVALRILHHRQLLRPLGSLGLSTVALQQVHDLVKRGEGIVLVTGPTGMGKTTTAYSLLHALDDGHRNIVTIEDPVELRVLPFLQMAVDRHHDVTMVSGLRTLLRMDPDIVMIGEIRGRETAEVAMRAASSGKYVISTFHTRDVASTVTALRDLNVDSRSLAGNLRAIISQRLVRRLCRKCCRRRAIEPHERQVFEAHGLEPTDELSVPVGCEDCRGTGYYERIGVFEIDANNAAVAMAIEHGAAEDEIRDMLHSSGNISLLTDALNKVREGITSLEEARSMTLVSFAGSEAASGN